MKGQKSEILASAAALSSLQSRLTSLNGQVSTLERQVSAQQSDISSLKSQVSALQSDDSSLKSQVSALQSDDSSLPGRVSALEQKLTAVSYSASGLNNKPTFTISGANLQVDSGSGSTDGTVNGLGNVIIGYDESPGTQTGSNNLVLGNGQAFSSYGGIIAGQQNTLSGPFSDVFGLQNTASGADSSVTGGGDNNASGSGSSVSGGVQNIAAGNRASVTGGEFNVANDPFSMIGGGCDNITGSGTKNTSTCDIGGEGVLGGASLAGTQKDGTYGVISDGVNFTTPGTISIDANAGQCGPVTLSVPGAAVGDVPAIEYGVALPAGLLIVPTGVTTAGQVNLSVCNESSGAVHYDNEPVRVMTFH